VNDLLNLNSILVFSEDSKNLAEFYQKVFQKDPDMSEGGYFGFLVGKVFFSIGPHDKVKGSNPSPERMMFNLETEDVKGEFDRVKKLEGTEVISEPYQMGDDSKGWIATLADPDGNYFQLMTPWEGNR
jgi:predicted enzyme related to lactoylglutathione lyase